MSPDSCYPTIKDGDLEDEYYIENLMDVEEVIEIEDPSDDPQFNFHLSSEESSDSEDEFYTERDDSILTFDKHEDPVFCCGISPVGDICATGGKDDNAYVWNFKTGELINKIDNHKDSVISVCFNHDGNYLATGDMSGELQVFRVTNNFERVWNFAIVDLFWLKWHKNANVIMCASGLGDIYIWRIPSGECIILPGIGEICKTAELTHDGKKLFCGYSKGSVKLWDIKNSKVIAQITPSSSLYHHTESVITVSCDSEKSLYLSGSIDGSVVLSNEKGAICKLAQYDSLVETCVFCPDSNLKIAAIATVDGIPEIWDLSKNTLRTKCTFPNVEDTEKYRGVTILKWLPLTEPILVYSDSRGNIHGFNGYTGEYKFTLCGHRKYIYEMEFNESENLLLTVSEDKTAKVFKISI